MKGAASFRDEYQKCSYDFCNDNTNNWGCSEAACIQAGAAAADADPASGWCIYVSGIYGDCVPNLEKCWV